MPIQSEKYIRKPLYVDAVRLTSANFDEIATWCQGEVMEDEVPGEGTVKKFIKVRVHNPKNPRQTKAFVGDWLLYTERGYKVYTNKAFHASFDVVKGEDPDLVDNQPEYPYEDGDVMVLGPEVFVAEGVVCYKGTNYYKVKDAVPSGQSIKEAVAEALAEQLGNQQLAEAMLNDREGRERLGLEEIKRREAVIEYVAEPGESVSAAGPVNPEVEVRRQMREELAQRVGREAAGLPPVKSGQAAEAVATATTEREQREMEPEKRMPEPEPVLKSAPVSTVDDMPAQESVEPAAVEGKRVLSIEEQREMTTDQVRELIQAGEAVLVQDIAPLK